MFNHYSVFGALERVRTSGLPLRRRPLYPAELRVRMKDKGDETFIGDCEDVPLRKRVLYPVELRMQIRFASRLIKIIGDLLCEGRLSRTYYRRNMEKSQFHPLNSVDFFVRGTMFDA